MAGWDFRYLKEKGTPGGSGGTRLRSDYRLPDERQQTLAMIRTLLRPRAHLALFENNPWNPGTRMVMRRIPFDRDAIPLSYLEARRRIKAAGFNVHSTRFLFCMPKALAPLRFIEPLFVNVPWGAQYYVLASAPEMSA